VIFLKCTGAIVLGMPGVIIGSLLVLSCVGAPLGVVVLIWSGAPLAHVIKEYNKKRYNKSLDQGAKPWM
jgi:hypothetical protein